MLISLANWKLHKLHPTGVLFYNKKSDLPEEFLCWEMGFCLSQIAVFLLGHSQSSCISAYFVYFSHVLWGCPEFVHEHSLFISIPPYNRSSKVQCCVNARKPGSILMKKCIDT